jgi:hypothetical protein
MALSIKPAMYLVLVASSHFALIFSLIFIGKIVDRMDTYLPTSKKKNQKSKQSVKMPLKLNTWLV